MNPRIAYQLQILEKVGAPLLAATQGRLTNPRALQNDQQDTRSEAAIVAELLSRSVQSGLSLAQMMDVKEQGAEGESVRLALTALGASLVAGLYDVHGDIPQESDMQRQITALSAALTFADNFSPAAANTGRLEDIEAGRIPGDETQVLIQCLNALSPVISVIAVYSFGRSDIKMMQEVTQRLIQKSTQMAQRLLPQAPLSEQKFAELGFLRALGLLYSEAHRTETKRVLDMPEQMREQWAQGGVIPLEGLWTDFERHAALLDVLGQSLLPAMMATTAKQPAPQQPVENKQLSAGFVAQGPQQPVPAPVSEKSGSPLSFFRPESKTSTATTGDEENT